MAEIETKHWCSQLANLGIEMGGFTSLYAQNWEGDINIVLPMGFSQVTMNSNLIFLSYSLQFV
jgi:TAG lipase/steryl ester hydrolase/phospholipase A2/LPA acyltransferase